MIQPIAKNALTILINISIDADVLDALAGDEAFLEIILSRLTVSFSKQCTQQIDEKDPNDVTANALAMLLANLTKSPKLERLITSERRVVSNATRTVAQLIEVYNLGKGWNEHADFDYLAYVFADLAKYSSFQSFLTRPAERSTIDPLSSFLPHTAHESPPRRLGTALLLRNLCLSHPDLLYLLQPAHSILPSILLPLCSSNQDHFTESEMDLLPPECQLLPPDHMQETDTEILRAHVETIYLLAARSGRSGRQVMRDTGTYVVIRELHLVCEDERVRDWCEKTVDLLQGDDESAQHLIEGTPAAKSASKISQHVDEVADDDIVPIY